MTNCELAHRKQIRAFRVVDYVLIVATGDLPTPGYDVDIVQSPLRIFPPQYNLLQCPRPGIWPQVLTPYRYAESVRHPADRDTITVHHATGSDVVQIEECPAELAPFTQAVQGTAERTCPPGATEAVGFSKKLSFEEAFAKAVANLPPVSTPVADALTRVQVIEIGGLFGGFAGFHDLFVRICRTRDS